MPLNNSIVCPSCNLPTIELVGSLVDANVFAGQVLQSTISGGNLYCCTSCNLFFRWPRLSQTILKELYEYESDSHWGYKTGVRSDWIFAQGWINKTEAEEQQNILDIGCWDGNFLESLSAKWKRYGLEINQSAAKQAQSRGVTLVGEDLYTHLDKKFINYFDVITTFDVIEHVDDPKLFLSTLLEYIRPGGIIIISTGNTDAWTWRLAQNQYYYCANPEHISFINVAWLEHQTSEELFEIIEIEKFSHVRTWSIYEFLKQTLANLLYLSVPQLFIKIRLGRWIALNQSKKKVINHPPVWNMSIDHFLVVLQKANLEEKKDG